MATPRKKPAVRGGKTPANKSRARGKPTRVRRAVAAPDTDEAIPGSDRRVERDDNGAPEIRAQEIEPGALRAFIDRIEHLEEEKKAIADDIKEVYAEAKGNGFDVKMVRKVVRLRKIDRERRLEEDEILGLYLSALGM